MNAAELQRMYDVETWHWYFAGKRRLVRAVLHGAGAGGRVLDVGCGTGGMVPVLREHGALVCADASAVALDLCRRRGPHHLVNCAGVLPFRTGTFDLVTAFDVIEHVDDDRELVGELARVCRPGGRLLLTVPAHQWLWSEHDVALGHRRRYARAQMRALLSGAGLAVEKLSYCFAAVFPAVAVLRALRRRGRTSSPRSDVFVTIPRAVNGALEAVVALESSLLRRGSLPFGVAVLALARKPCPEDRA